MLDVIVILLVCFIIFSIFKWNKQKSQDAQQKSDLDQPIKVQILNGCGVRGLADVVRDVLMKFEIDVREMGNAESFIIPETIILDRINDKTKAQQVAKLLGIDNSRVIQQINESLIDIDVSVILGKDYKDYLPEIPEIY